MNCESCELLLADALYEPDLIESNDGLRTHLEECNECSALYQELTQAIEELKLAGMVANNLEDIPERAGLDGLWQNLEPELNKVDAQRYRTLPKRSVLPFASGIAALAACVVIFFAFFSPNSDQAVTTPLVVKTVNPEVMEYLDRAQVMLMQVANSATPDANSLPIAQTFARDMALEANFLSTGQDDGIKSGQRRLLRDIEFLLLQIANLDESNAEMGVELLQRFLEENNVLFKIRLLELRDQQNVI